MNASSLQTTPPNEATTELILGQSKELASTMIKVPLVLPDGTGCLSNVKLELWETPTADSPLAGQWVAPARLKVNETFHESLLNARSAVNALDSGHPLWPDDSRLAVCWEFPHPPAEGVTDGSAGCIFALGLVELFRHAQRIPTEHRHHSLMHTRRAFPFLQLTASARISATGELGPVGVNGLAAKEQATGMKNILHLVVSREQQKKAGLAAASTLQEHPCSNLNEVLLKIATVLGEEPGMKATLRKPWLRWTLMAAAIVLLITGVRLFLEAYPSTAQLKSRLPFDVYVHREGCPTDCSFVVNIAKTTDYTWATRTWNPLQKVRSNFAMVMGADFRQPHDNDQVHLGSFGELQGLRSLYVSQSEVTDLQGAENLRNLERFVNLGGRLRDLRWLGELPRLRVLVLDSPHTKIYPGLRSSSLEKLIAHLPEDRDYLSFRGCSNLRCLALRGDGLTELFGLDELPYLEEVILHIKEIGESAFQKGNHIHSLELAHCQDSGRLEVGGTFPMLRRLTLKDTHFTELTGLDKASHLESLVIEESQGLERLDVSGLKNLRRLIVRRTPLKEIKGLASCTQLRELLLYKVELSGISIPQENQSLEELTIIESPLTVLGGVGKLLSLKQLFLYNTKIAKLESLAKLQRLEVVDMHESMLDELPSVSGGHKCFLNAEATPLHQKQNGIGYFETSSDGQNSWVPINKYAFPNYDYSYEISPNYYLEPEFYAKRAVNLKAEYAGMIGNERLFVQILQDGSSMWFDTNGWSYEDATKAGERGFDVRALMLQWGIHDQIGLGGYSSYYDGTSQDPESRKVRPLAKKQDQPPVPSAKPPPRDVGR